MTKLLAVSLLLHCLCLAALLGTTCLAEDGTAGAITQLDSLTFYQLLQEEPATFNAVIDVRSSSEWEEGRIENATFVENLASFGTGMDEVSTPSDLAGCQNCSIVAYCGSGARAQIALENLLDAGFQGRLYNGQGVSQWTAAGLPLVTDVDSVTPPCTVNATAGEQCQCRLESLACAEAGVPGDDSTSQAPGDDSTSQAPVDDSTSQAAASITGSGTFWLGVGIAASALLL